MAKAPDSFKNDDVKQFYEHFKETFSLLETAMEGTLPPRAMRRKATPAWLHVTPSGWRLHILLDIHSPIPIIYIDFRESLRHADQKRHPRQ